MALHQGGGGAAGLGDAARWARGGGWQARAAAVAGLAGFPNSFKGLRMCIRLCTPFGLVSPAQPWSCSSKAAVSVKLPSLLSLPGCPICPPPPPADILEASEPSWIHDINLK